jgi:hypothetical protein
VVVDDFITGPFYMKGDETGYSNYQLHITFYLTFFSNIEIYVQTKLLLIFSVDIDTVHQLLTEYSTCVRYLEKKKATSVGQAVNFKEA